VARISSRDIMGRKVGERLLAEAAELFARKGYAATTVNEIVAATGVTKPALYYYFRNKEGIYLELMQDALAKFEVILDTTLMAKGRASKKIGSLCDKLLALIIQNIQLAKVLYALSFGPPQGAPFFDSDVFHFKFRDAVGRLVDEGIAKGEFRRANRMDMAWAILGAVNIAIEVELCQPELSIGREGLARVLALIFDGLRLPASQKV
jgi:TetR/AcrR family transcriptional regulator